LLVHDDGTGRALYQIGKVDGAYRLLRWTEGDWIPMGAAFNARPSCAIAFDDGVNGTQIYAGGGFTSIGGYSINRVSRWDGKLWRPLGGGVSLSNSSEGDVRALAVYDSGAGPRLIIAGKFDVADNGVMVKRIAAWDGTSFSPLGAGFDNHVDA